MVTIVGVVVFVGTLDVGVVEQADYLFESDVLSISRSLHGESPFVEAVTLGAWLHEHTDANDTIGIVGSEAEIAFYAQRQLASGYLYLYPLLERHAFAAQMQNQWSTELQEALPRYVVFVDIDLSWSQPSSVVFPFLLQLEPWLRTHYRPVMLIPIALNGETEPRATALSADAPPHLRRGNRGVFVFERR